jgi:hypothetical protein
MKRTVGLVSLLVLSSLLPAPCHAKGATTRIVIEGADLAQPVEITDRRVLANFGVWTGPGTFSTGSGFDPNAPSFLIDWSKGPTAQPPEALRRYRVSFYAKELGEGPIYVVDYAPAQGAEPGHVYLPGKSDERWRLNVRSILRGVEGQWFRAWSRWEAVARPLIRRAGKMRV